ncbi:hypothetical protein ICN84_05305 [Akkermansia glycaniphila]|nr:hypothetical protein [Akkermansia glycaniphila]
MQIAEIDATDETAPYVAKTYRWDPSEPVATRPLALSLWTREGTARETLYYAHDLRKNVVSLFDAKGLRRASYQYDPYGNITSMEGDMTRENPFRFSSEYHDEDLGLVYYNYRHYNPTDGRWVSRDPIAERGGWNLYGFVGNGPTWLTDLWGLFVWQYCTRYWDGNEFAQICELLIVDSCNCSTCDYLHEQIFNATNEQQLQNAVSALMKCLEQEMPSGIDATYIGPIITNIYENTKKNYKGIRDPLPERTYRILPKPNGGDEDIGKNPINFHLGTPSITDLDEKRPGYVKDKGVQRTGLRIHGMGLSQGCIAGSGAVTNHPECQPYFVPKRDMKSIVSKSGLPGQKGLIEELMDQHMTCGGYYVTISDSQEPMPEFLKNIRKQAEVSNALILPPIYAIPIKLHAPNHIKQ